METTDSSRQIYLRLLSYMRPYAKVFGVAIIAMVVTAATEPALPALMKPLLDAGFSAGKPIANASSTVFGKGS